MEDVRQLTAQAIEATRLALKHRSVRREFRIAATKVLAELSRLSCDDRFYSDDGEYNTASLGALVDGLAKSSREKRVRIAINTIMYSLYSSRSVVHSLHEIARSGGAL